jgi:hypothetical protein
MNCWISDLGKQILTFETICWAFYEYILIIAPKYLTSLSRFVSFKEGKVEIRNKVINIYCILPDIDYLKTLAWLW